MEKRGSGVYVLGWVEEGEAWDEIRFQCEKEHYEVNR